MYVWYVHAAGGLCVHVCVFPNIFDTIYGSILLYLQFYIYHAMIRQQGAVSIRKTVLPGMAIPMLKIRRPNGRLIFNMEIAIRR